MRWRARTVAWIAVILAVLLQGAFVTRLGIPFQLTPVVVVVAAMRMTRNEAALLGFGAGLLLDIAPPASGVLGAQAFVLCLAAYFASANQHLVPHVWWARALFAAGLSTLAQALVLVIQLLAGQPLPLGVGTGMSIVWQFAIGLLLSLALWPASKATMGPQPRRRMGVAP
ncbi:MAG: rod shape-determining protein MreD [Actinobacteria bacterium]|nr:rod shape-determining protein MreD [Actinomycetota bacterium]MCB9413243.1 rod shape-determining protein MreD [Actinomycetota bacterium]